MAHFREVLFKKNFFSLWSSQIVSEFGDRLNQMALIALVYAKHPGDAMALAKLLFFIVVPVFVIGPIAGVYVDRWDRKKVMIIADIFRGVMVLFVPLFVWLDLMIPVYIIVFLMFSATRFFLPSKLAIIPTIVPEEKLIVANSLSNTTRILATIFGFGIAGFVVKLIGYKWGFFLDSASYFVSASFIAVITPKKDLSHVKEDIQMTGQLIEKSIRKNIWHEIVEGFGYMINKSKMKIVTSALFIIMAGTGAIFCIIIVFIQESFGSITEALGAFGVCIGVGLFFGTILYGKFGQHISKIMMMFICFSLCGVFIALFALYAKQDPMFVIGGVLIMLVGMAAAPILTCTNTLIHLLVPDEVRGRIFSSMEAIMHLGFMLFMFITAYMAKFISNISILLISAAVFTCVGIIGLVAGRGKELIA